MGWQVALTVIGVLLWFLAVGLDIVGVVVLILLAREKCKLWCNPRVVVLQTGSDQVIRVDLVVMSLIVDHSSLPVIECWRIVDA